MTTAEIAHSLLIQTKLTLSLAESCTGGTLASQLTRLPGSSSFFLGGIVAYSNTAKNLLLGVEKNLIDTHGAVSAEVVEAMAKGVQERLQSAISLAVTGVAGPDGGTPNKPVGTVWCCLARKGKKSRVWLLQLHGNREEIILASCQSLLEALIEECRPHT